MIELSIDERLHSELECEAERLGITVEQVAVKAISAWITDMNEQEPAGNETCAQ